MRADLHVHSTASDGTDAPADLVRAAAQAGLDAVALVDHDTTAGWAQAQAAAPPGLTVLPGIEVSCAAVLAGVRHSVHLLAYGPDPAHRGLAEALAWLRRGRAARGEAMVARLADLGVPITQAEVRDVAGSAPIGRPHLAQVLVDRGLVPDVAAAFTEDWIGTGGRGYVPKPALDPATAVRLVLAAGGVPVLAHPGAPARGGPLPDAVFAAMCAAGLAGVEVDHPEHDRAARGRLRALAARYGLLCTGGSDYHGTRKRIALGAETVGADRLRALLDRMPGPIPSPG